MLSHTGSFFENKHVMIVEVYNKVDLKMGR